MDIQTSTKCRLCLSPRITCYILLDSCSWNFDVSQFHSSNLTVTALEIWIVILYDISVWNFLFRQSSYIDLHIKSVLLWIFLVFLLCPGNWSLEDDKCSDGMIMRRISSIYISNSCCFVSSLILSVFLVFAGIGYKSTWKWFAVK